MAAVDALTLGAAGSMMEQAPRVRCAIYTRTSALEGLTQTFNSLDSQRLACSHYIASQVAEGWAELDERYDDGGHSGGSVVRPALQRMLKDVERGVVGTVVVYKIDRLSRSLRDFMQLMELFERHGVGFVSVTQQFSTTSSMGRLTLNVLLSFAQFEREITGERIKDKFAIQRAKGMRPSGGRPFGYRVEDHLLVVDHAEAAVVRRIFKLYIRLGSPVSIPATLNEAGLVNQQGRPFNDPFIRRVLRNRLYRGDLTYLNKPCPGSHPRIVSERVWAKAQAVRAPHVARWRSRRHPTSEMLSGLLFGPTGPLRHESSMTKGKVYRYYRPPEKIGGVRQCGAIRYRAVELEQAILAAVDPDARLRRDPASDTAGTELVRSLVERVDVGDHIAIMLKTGRTIVVPNAPRLGTSRCHPRPSGTVIRPRKKGRAPR